MKRITKKLFVLVATVVMICSMSGFALAANTCSHSWKVYRQETYYFPDGTVGGYTAMICGKCGATYSYTW